MRFKLSEKEIGYLSGLFEGDGYKFYDKKQRHYSIEFYLNSVNDKEIIIKLVGLLQKRGLNPNLYQDKRYNCKRIRVYSKEFFKMLNKNTDLTLKPNSFNVGFISGLIDSEGYVNPAKSYIMIINTNKHLLEKCKSFLNKINIEAEINKRKPCKKDKLNSYRMYISVKFKNKSNLSVKTERLQI